MIHWVRLAAALGTLEGCEASSSKSLAPSGQRILPPMSDEFDAYYQWLGIAPKDQPPNHYRLLGVDLFESSPDVIETAADRQIIHIRTFQSGPQGDASQKLLNEITTTKLCL